jgi:hypothetical protein
MVLCLCAQIRLLRDVEGQQFVDALNQTLVPRMTLAGKDPAGLQPGQGASSLRTLLTPCLPTACRCR